MALGVDSGASTRKAQPPARELVERARKLIQKGWLGETSFQQRCGWALYAWWLRPWAIRTARNNLRAALGGPPTLNCCHPSGPAAAPAEVVEIHKLFHSRHGFRWGPYLLGQTFLVLFLLLKRQWRVAFECLLLRPTYYSAPFVKVDEPFFPAEPRMPGVTRNFRCFGPTWFQELCRPEQLNGDFPLIGLDAASSQGLDALREIPGRRAVWILSEGNTEWTQWLRPEDEIFVLPPAVQPRLQNPVGWWNSDDQTESRWSGEDDLPAQWSALQAVARGQHSGTAPAPPWASAEWRRCAGRYLSARQAVSDEAILGRLELIRTRVGLPSGAPCPPLVSVVIPSNRPDLVLSSLDSFRRQTWPHRELILVLHGSGFDEKSISSALAKLEHPSRMVKAPPQWKLGHCLELGGRYSRGRYVAIMDDDNWFGARYLEDGVLWMEATQAMAGGKFTMPVYFRQNSSLHLILPGMEFRRSHPSSAQAFIRRDLLEVLPWRSLTAAADTRFFTDAQLLGVPQVTLDRFNFAYCRGREDHAYQIRPEKMLKLYRALPLAQTGSASDCDL